MVSGFGQVFKSDLRRSCLRPSAEQGRPVVDETIRETHARKIFSTQARVGIWGPLLEA